MSRWASFFGSSPEWRDISDHLRRRLDESTKELITLAPTPEADPVTLIAEFRSLQHKIKEVYWLLNTLPAALTAEDNREHSVEEQEGSYGEVADEGEVAGTENFVEGAAGGSY